LREDRHAQVADYVALFSQGGIPKHKAAQVAGIEIGELEDGDVIYMPLNLVPVRLAGDERVTESIALSPSQASTALDIVSQVSAGTISYEAGSNSLQVLFGLSAEQAARLLGAGPAALPAASRPRSSETDGGTEEAPDATEDTRKTIGGNGRDPATRPGVVFTKEQKKAIEEIVRLQEAKESRFSPEQKAAHAKAVDRLAVSWEKKFAEGARKAFEVDKREIFALVTDAKQKALATKASIAWQESLLGVNDYLAMAGNHWRETFVPLMQGVMTAQGERWATELGMSFNVRNFFAEEWFDKYTLQFAQPINDTTTDAMAAMFKQAQGEGWSVPEMQSHLTAMFDQWMNGNLSAEDFKWFAERMPPYRTESISRTETIRSSNAGTNQLFNEWGVKRKEWLSTNDDRTRPEHIAANGQVVGINEKFNVGGEELEFPGDPNGSPENTIQCRCTTLPVV